MSLKFLVCQKLMNEVIKNESQHGQMSSKVDWRVLIVDKFSMRMISSCLTMHELSAEGITLVEDINKKREPLQTMEAVYLLTPCEDSIQKLIQDFDASNRPIYKSAYVYFTEAISDSLFDKMKGQSIVKFMKACKEINVSFLPCEKQVFSLDSPNFFQSFYSSSQNSKTETMEKIAEQIATLCATLGEFPSIRYRSDWNSNLELSELIRQKLEAYKNDEPKMGEGPETAKSILLILDRGFDCISPLLHELTFQAMAYDLLPISNDVYKYDNKEVLLDENDELWCALRHEHIAVVSQKVTTHLKNFIESKPISSTDKASIRDLSQMIKKMPQYQKELSKYATHLQLTEDCMNAFQGKIKSLCKIEQDLAMGKDADDEEIKDPMSQMAPILLDPSVSNNDKIRIILLYIMNKNGVSKENFEKVATHANLEKNEREILLNLNHLGVNVVNNGNNQNKYRIPRKERISENTYQMSRWTPILKDIMEDTIDNKLDTNHFPFLINRTKPTFSSVAKSTRFGRWRDEKAQKSEIRNVPRLIVFIVGGMSYSEMRCAYEVTKAYENWEVILGSTHILTPEIFLKNLSEIS
ncbi:hypothetical protein PVAND_016260 [Polypedilum vanderplanki]|uniref:Uncharacterized protein n=1 Tax=Polypedilum vanderplanki TaxID=319348 RepID=A0A9J6BFQ0_POLVA|nr:hypothetical protein PVAND_016260 [Polypedilum vanderplanki]